MVMRRLRRLCHREYRSDPRFVITSATIANPDGHAASLLGESAICCHFLHLNLPANAHRPLSVISACPRVQDDFILHEGSRRIALFGVLSLVLLCARDQVHHQLWQIHAHITFFNTPHHRNSILAGRFRQGVRQEHYNVHLSSSAYRGSMYLSALAGRAP